MAEQVEITNVGNTGVASEVTLKLLLEAMEKMAKNAGMDPKTVKEKTKQLQEETKGIKNVIFSLEDNKEAFEDNTKSVKDSTSALDKFGNVLLNVSGKVLGTVTGSLVGLTKELFNSSYGLGNFTQHLPIIGQLLVPFADNLQRTLDELRSLSSVGASFNNSLVELKLSAAESFMSLDEYTSMIRQNTERLSAFGGTVTNGTFQTRQLFKALGSTREELMNMGMSIADINESLIFYQYLNRAGSRAQTISAQSQAQAAAEYAKQLSTLAKLTGQDVKSMQDKLAAQQADVAFQMKLAKLRPEEREKVQQGLAEALSMAGETGALFFKQQFLGMPPLTRETQLFQATMSESAEAIKRMQQEAASTGVTLSQFKAGSVDRLADFVEGSAKAGARLEDVLAAASGGLEGPAAELAAIFKQQGKQFTDYLDVNGNFQRNKFEQDVEAAQTELDQQEKIASAMNAFENTIKQTKSTIMDQLIKTGVFDTAAKAVEAFGKFMEAVFTPSRIAVISNFFKSINEALDKFMNSLSTDGVMSAVGSLFADVGSVLIDGLSNAIAGLWSESKIIAAMVVGIGGLFAYIKLKNLFTGMFGSGDNNTDPNNTGLSRVGKGLNTLGAGAAGLGKGIGKGIGGIFTGVGNALALLGPKAPMILAGAAAIGGSITLIGAGIAGATWLIGASLPKLSDGLQTFKNVDGEKLKQAGIGMAALGAGIAAFGAGSVVSAVGNIAGNILDGLNSFFGGSTIFDKLEEFASYNFDAARVENNAKAVTAFGTAMMSAGAGRLVGSYGNAAANIIDGIVSFFGGETIPYSEIIDFSKYNFEKEKIEANAEAVKAFAEVFRDFPEVNSERVGGLFGLIGLIFSGVVTMPWDRVKEFGDVDIKTDAVSKNAGAVKAFAEAFQDFPDVDSERVGGLFGAIGLIFSGVVTMPWDRVKEFGNIDIAATKVKENAEAVKAFADAFQNFPEINSERVGGFFGAIGHIFSGSITMPWDRVNEFAAATVNKDGVVKNSEAIRAFADAFKDFPSIDGDRVGGLFGVIGRIFSGKIKMPWDRVNDFAAASMNMDGIKANAGAIVAFSDAFKNFPVIDTERVGGFFNWVVGLFAGTEVMPWDRVKEFGNVDIDATRVKENADALVEFSRGIKSLEGVKLDSIAAIEYGTIRSLEQFSKIGPGLGVAAEQLKSLSVLSGVETPIVTFNSALKVDAVKSYTSAIEDLQDALADLNKELARSNDTLFEERLSAGEVMQNITATNSVNAENIQSLNTTLVEILKILTENKEIDSRIERNTRSFGSDISRGSITAR